MLKILRRPCVSLIPLTVIGLGLSSCKGCQDDVQEVVDMCESEADTTYLVSVRNVDFDEIGTKLVTDPSRILNICQDHFAANTDGGHEVIVATNELTDIEGVSIYYGRTWLPHENKANLFSLSPTDDWFDYVDNQLDTSADHPCHNDGSILCGDTDTEDGWAINTCKFNGTIWNGVGDTEYFTVSANVYCYDHYSDPTSDDHPNSHGILHELAHGMGMNHTDAWADADKKYMSTMQGKHIHLTALDVAYLRERYPDSMPDHRNYVAGSKTRFDDGAGGWDARVFWEDNPLEFYVDANGNLKSCGTKNDPEFHVSWFNTGNLDGEEDICGVNRLFLRDEDGSQTIDLYTWKMATMPYLSQDQWKGTVKPDPADIAAVDFTKTYSVVFQVNAWGTQDELRDDDNELSYEVTIYPSSFCN